MTDSTNKSLFTKTSDERILLWDKFKIIKSLEKETGLDRDIAERVADEVEELIKYRKLKVVTTTLIRELVNAELINRGFIKERNKYCRLGMPINDIKNLIIQHNKENANVPHNPEATNLTIAGNIKKEFALLEVFPKDVSEAHLKGDIHLHDLDYIDRPYSFMRNETIIVRDELSVNIFCMSFEQLFNFIKNDIHYKNGFEIKYAKNIAILDKNNKWTELKRVIRHKADKKLLSITTNNGKNVIVTEDHPFVLEGNKTDILRISDLIIPSHNIEIGNKAITEKLNIPTMNKSFYLDICWLIGLFIAEGFYEKNTISIKIKEELFNIIKNILCKYNIKFGEDKRNNRIRIHNKKMKDFFINTLLIRPYSENINLPVGFLNYGNEEIGALISGIIDGDGTIKTDKWISQIIIRLTSKTMLCQIQNWLDLIGIRSYLMPINSYGRRNYKDKIIESKKQIYKLSFTISNDTKYLFKNSHKISNHDFKYSKGGSNKDSKIKDIREIKNDSEYVYDITTKSHTFLCNGILVHNCGGQNLEYIKKFGLNLPNALSIAKPAKHPEVLILHLMKFSAALQGCFAGAIGWDAINVFIAPYLVRKTYKEIKQLAQILIFEFSQQAVARGGQAIFSDINLYWEIPKHFENVPAIGPGGKYTGYKYESYRLESRKFIEAIFETYLEGDGGGRPFMWPKPNLHITKKFFQESYHEKFLELASEVASKMGNTYFIFDRGSGVKISECCRLKFNLSKEDIKESTQPWKMRFSALQNITINLPRIIYESKGNFEKITKLLYQRMELAVKAHICKRKFIEKLLSKKHDGPLSLLAMDLDGETYLRINKTTNLIGMVGLNEAIKAYSGKELHENKESFMDGLRIISLMHNMSKELSIKYGINLILEQTPAESTAYRFANLDIDNFPEARLFVKGDIKNKQTYYTNSTQLSVASHIDPIKRVNLEGKFHKLIEAGSMTHIWLGEHQPDKKSIAQFVETIFRNTSNDQVCFSPEFTSCKKCFKTSRGLNEKCIYCGSKEVEGITRITGYFSKISGWNPGKIQELRDRKKWRI